MQKPLSIESVEGFGCTALIGSDPKLSAFRIRLCNKKDDISRSNLITVSYENLPS